MDAPVVAVAGAAELSELPPQAERAETAGTRIQTRRITTSYDDRLPPDSEVL